MDNAPGQPATAKGRATRDRIVDAACELALRDGIGEFSIDDLREATGTSKSQVYHYFADRTDLVRAVVHRQGERVLEGQVAALRGDHGWDRLAAWRRAMVAQIEAAGCHGGCPVGSLANELAEVDDLARRDLAETFITWQDLLEETLGQMVIAGELLSDTPVSDLALATIASLQGGFLLSKTSQTTRPLEVALDASFAHIGSYSRRQG